MGLEKLPELPNVPSALEIVKDPQKKKVLTLILMRQEPGRPVAAPPGVPADRVAALRKAFEETMKDPDFVKEATKLNMEIEPMTGAQIDKLLAGGLRDAKADRAAGRQIDRAPEAEREEVGGAPFHRLGRVLAGPRPGHPDQGGTAFLSEMPATSAGMTS